MGILVAWFSLRVAMLIPFFDFSASESLEEDEEEEDELDDELEDELELEEAESGLFIRIGSGLGS